MSERESRSSRPLVFVVKESRAQWVYIFPGRTNGFETEVLADSASGQIPLVKGDTVLVEFWLTGTHSGPLTLGGRTIQPTGKSYSIPMCTVGHWKNGVMAEEWLYWDNAAFMRQIGIGQ